jgi:ribosomal protein S27E
LSTTDGSYVVGDIKYGREIGKETQPSGKFVYTQCEECGIKWWIRTRAVVPKCTSCSRRKPRHDISKEPVVGEIRYGEEIGKPNEFNTKFVYQECSWCGIRWWTSIYSKATKCSKCSAKKPRKRDCGKPKLGDVRWGDEIGEGFRKGARYEYRRCEDCGVEWWAGLNNSNPKCLTKCFVCVHREPRKYPEGEPVVGEIRWGDEIGRKAESKKQFIWRACEICGVEKWVQSRKGEATNKKCINCRMVGVVSRKHIENRIKKIRDTKEKVCRRCGNTYPATVEYFSKVTHSILGIGALCIPCHRKYMNDFSREKNQFIGERLSNSVRAAIYNGLKDNKKGRHWEELVGYSIEDLISHLESQFKDGMTWENYGQGKGCWHIDHWIPRSAFYFEYASDLDFKRCWALSNLQPLWGDENAIKNAKIVKPFQPSLYLYLKDSFRNKKIKSMMVKDLPLTNSYGIVVKI